MAVWLLGRVVVIEAAPINVVWFLEMMVFDLKFLLVLVPT